MSATTAEAGVSPRVCGNHYRRSLCAMVFAGAMAICGLVSCAGGPLKQQASTPMKKAIRPVKADRIQKAYADFTMAALYAGEGDYAQARVHLERAIQNDPESVYLRREIAILLREMKEYGRAAEHAQKAISLDPRN